MIRTAWAVVFAAFSTFFFGSVVFFAALFRVKGRIYFWATSQWGKSLLWASASNVRIHGFTNVDWSKPHVLVSNHIGAFDILALAASVPVRYHFVAKKELEKIPIFGPAWKNAGHISIDRENRQKAVASLRHAADIIHREGGVVIIFPEGTRSRTGELMPFKKGAFVLAIEAGVPIIPAVVVGSDRIMESGRLRVRPGTIDLHFGDPLPSDGHSAERVEVLVAQVRARMQDMLDGALASTTSSPS